MRYALIITLLLAGLAFLYYGNISESTPETSTTKAASVYTYEVARIDYTPLLHVTGEALANEAVAITSQQTERLKTIHFTEGQRVQKGDTLVTLEVAEEIADIAATKAVLHDAQTNYKRLARLAARDAISKSELDAAASALEVARTALKRAQVAHRERLITAPFSGTIGIRRVSEGALLEANTVITTLADAQLIKLRMNVPERYSTHIRIGQSFTASSPTEHNISGTITAIDAQLDAMSRTLSVQGVIKNEDKNIRPGITLNVTLPLQAEIILAVPEETLVPIASKHYVYRIKENIAHKQEVRIGRQFDGKIEITDGLEVGDAIVTEGQLRLRDGQSVSVITQTKTDTPRNLAP